MEISTWSLLVDALWSRLRFDQAHLMASKGIKAYHPMKDLIDLKIQNDDDDDDDG